MTRRDQPSPVRPLTPGDAGTPNEPIRRPTSLSRAVTAGVLVVVLMVAVFGAGGADEVPGPDPVQSMVAADVPHIEITTTTLAARFSERIPIETDRLSAISRSDDPQMVVWLPSERFARSYRLQSDPRSASFDATGGSVAYIDHRSTLFAGRSGGDAAVRIEAMVSAARFHPTEAAELAYTASPADASTTDVYRIRVTPGLVGGLEPELVTTLPGSGRLLTWGNWGYAVAVDRPRAVVILDDQGRAIRAMPGVPHAAGGDAFLIDALPDPRDDPEAVTKLAPVVVAPESAFGVFDQRFEPIFLFPGFGSQDLNVTISPDGLRIAVSTFTNTGGTSITIRDRSVDTLRTVRIDSVAHPIGFVADGTHIAMQDNDSRELIFVNWRTGAHYRLSGLTGDFIAVDL